MTTDRNKDITSISYNHLNLPTQINFGTGTNKITYTYSATGQKQSKAVFNNGVTTITQYAGAYTYEKIGTGAYTLQYIAQPEGYIYKTTSGVYQYAYQYKDHLGNIRLSYTDSNKDGVVTPSEIIEENNYYPFGMKHKGYNAVVNSTGNANAQKIKYNGKEYQDELGLNVTAMDFRQYDNAIGRFLCIDAMAEIMPTYTPYRFGFNNPLIWSDPSGLNEIKSDPNKPIKPIQLDEVVVYGKAKGKTTMPSNFNYSLLNNVKLKEYKGDLKSYNKEFGTNYHGNRARDQWYFNNYYLPARAKSIQSIHEAQRQVAISIAVVAGSVYAAPILAAASPSIVSTVSTIISNPLVNQGALNITLNASSQYIANGGVVGDINIIEASLSGVPGTNLIPTIAGETFSFTANDGLQGPESLGKWATQVTGGIISNRFGKATDIHFSGEDAQGKIVGEYFKFIIETGSNAAPNLIK